MSGKRFEWRVGWEASTNASFAGYSEWEPWKGEETDSEAIQEAVSKSSTGYDDSLATQAMLNGSGITWWVEVREAAGDE